MILIANGHMPAPVGRGTAYFQAVTPWLQRFDHIYLGLTVTGLQAIAGRQSGKTDLSISTVATDLLPAFQQLTGDGLLPLLPSTGGGWRYQGKG